MKMFPMMSRTRLQEDPEPSLARQIWLVPEHVILDITRPILQVCSMFDYSIEFILDGMIEAVSDRVSSYEKLRYLNKRLSNTLADSPVFGRHDIIDRLIAVEQSALDLSEYFDRNRMYLYGRYLPYQFEHLMDNGSLLLKRYADYQEFCDKVGTELGFFED